MGQNAQSQQAKTPLINVIQVVKSEQKAESPPATKVNQEDEEENKDEPQQYYYKLIDCSQTLIKNDIVKLNGLAKLFSKDNSKEKECYTDIELLQILETFELNKKMPTYTDIQVQKVPE